MHKNVTFDRMHFLRRLEKSCETALHDVRAFPCEETAHRASGMLEGLLHGAAAALSALHVNGNDPSLLDEARSIVERYRSELAGLLGS